MGQGNPPVIRIQVVKKTDKSKKVYIGSVWLRDDEQGLSAKFDTGYNGRPGIAAIKFTDGTVAKVEDLFLNVYDERMRRDGDSFGGGGSTNRGGRQCGNGGPPDDQGGEMGDDDIPF
jgi:hypothetical protein